MKPWEIAGGDPWYTYDEAEVIVHAAEQLSEARRKQAEKAKKAKARVPHRPRRR